MKNELDINFSDYNKLEIHYWLKNNIHSIDAFTENKCTYEILNIIRDIAKFNEFEIHIETEALGEGGIRKWLKIVTKEENKKGTITSAVIIAIVVAILQIPFTKIPEKLIDKIFEDTELNELQKEKLRKEIEGIEIDNQVKLLENPTIRKRRSNFYENLDKNTQVESVSFDIQDEKGNSINKEKKIYRNEFKSFIITNDDLEPQEIEEAIIEIISPVLKKGKYKWSGYYNGEPIFFNMKSNEFKTLVQNGYVEFKNGFTINCAITIKKKVDNEGQIKISGYEVTRVNEYFINDKPIQTREGRKYKSEKNNSSEQLNLFTSLDNQ